MSKFVISPDGVFLNGTKIARCDEVTITDINPIKQPTVTLRVAVDEVDIRYPVSQWQQRLLSRKLREERNDAD